MTSLFSGLAICFDLDGTLIDTAPDLVAATNAVMRKADLPEIALQEVRAMIGLGAGALINKAAGAAGKTFEADELAQHVAFFLETYEQNLTGQSQPFDGVIEVLSQLEGQGAILSVCTNKPAHLAGPVLDAFDMAKYFKAVVGHGQAGANKPDGRHISYTVAASGGSLARAIMVGDSAADVQGARNAGVPVIVTSFGYTIEKASALGADAVFDHYREVPDLIEHIMQSKP